LTLACSGDCPRDAAEQAMLNFFPPGFPGRARCAARGGRAVTVVAVGSKRTKGVCLYSRSLSDAVKESFYRAALPHLPFAPPWGSLAGIRPACQAAKWLAQGKDAREWLLARHVEPSRARLALECAAAHVEALRGLDPCACALYVSVPFCPQRCAYCSFVSADVTRASALAEPYVEMLAREIAAARAVVPRPVAVYVGGGTPTALSAGQLDKLLAALPLPEGAEFTVEAGRPDTLTREKLAVMRSRGVGRVSVNPQSMNAVTLSAIGRSHTPEDVRRAYALARSAGFAAVNMDIIAGLPGETEADFARTVDEVLALEPENITTHTLAPKKGAALYSGAGHPRLRAAAARRMLDYAYARLRKRGYGPYYLYRQKFTPGMCENVGWTKPGHENLYNLCMMEELCTVIAAGAGAVTKLVSRGSGQIIRLQNCKYPLEYLRSRDKIESNIARAARFLSAAR
jgi:oxygen-independent coproporphyrinogen-3 oxidase